MGRLDLWGGGTGKNHAFLSLLEQRECDGRRAGEEHGCHLMPAHAADTHHVGDTLLGMGEWQAAQATSPRVSLEKNINTS